MAEGMKAQVSALLRGIDRYNPENLGTLERYVELQCRDNTYDLEASLAVLKLYQFNPMYFQTLVTAQILLKALTNLPHTDFILCKCLIDAPRLSEEPINKVMMLHGLLETCCFKEFWQLVQDNPDLIGGITGFEDNIRKFICHVISITYQTIQRDILTEMLGGISDLQVKNWILKYGWKDSNTGFISVANQEESVKTKNITEKITFDSVCGIMAIR
ncbi:unnamed protein product [Owenia fusiformis]|uniref:Eukaryotic translation initiation factor 3 subunit K n=1 Tax=Owenia fusiformis TaxID=6347 RepID=A0A8J1XXN8_OWEFU|nr:unnamed protein product [Owenia fusiformis]